HDLVVIARDSVLQVLIRIRSRDNEQSIFPNYVHPPESATFEVNDDTKTLTLEDAKEGEWRWQMFHLDTVKNTWSGETKDGVCDLSDVNNYGDFIIELKKKRSLAAFTRKMRKQE
ncbi:MAG: hypothetical protein QF815_02365, partial [Candidatus Peribacteraceae bacterium]|nr:hypothetical protein [Candidatus Peribacteraceae bacterium]